MTRIAPRTLTAVAALTLGTGFAPAPALADITADDAWAIWQSQMQAVGLTMSADLNRDGDALDTGTLSISATFPMDAGSFGMTMPGLRFEPDGQGGVVVQMPEASAIDITLNVMGEPPITARIETTLTNSAMVMTGDPGNVVTTWSADAGAVSVQNISLGADMPEQMSFTYSFEGYQSASRTIVAPDLLHVSQEGTIEQYNYEFKMVSGSGDYGTVVSEVGSGQGTKYEHEIALPALGSDLLALHEALRNGLSLKAVMRSDVVEAASTSSMGGDLFLSESNKMVDYTNTVTIDAKGANLAGTSGLLEVAYELADFGVPMKFAAQAVTFELAMPLLKSETPQAAAFVMALTDMTLNEELWALADPGAALSRDPMQFEMDLTGEVMINDEVLDIPALMERAEFGDLIQPISVQLNKMRTAALGTETTGSGAFTFDNSDMVTVPGIPRPEGVLDVKITGLNTLLDLLESSGIVSAEELLGVRMGMGMIVVPGEGEDTMVSKFEFTSEGHFLANGMRLK